MKPEDEVDRIDKKPPPKKMSEAQRRAQAQKNSIAIQGLTPLQETGRRLHPRHVQELRCAGRCGSA